MFGLSFRHVIHDVFYKQSLTDVQSTGAVVRCFHCRMQIIICRIEAEYKDDGKYITSILRVSWQRF